MLFRRGLCHIPDKCHVIQTTSSHGWTGWLRLNNMFWVTQSVVGTLWHRILDGRVLAVWEVDLIIQPVNLTCLLSLAYTRRILVRSTESGFGPYLIYERLFHRVKAVMVILTYSTSKNYGVLDVAVSQRLFVVCVPYVYFRLVPAV